MNKQTRDLVFALSGIMALVGAVFYITHWLYSPYLFATGAAGITVCFMTVPYKDLDTRQRRLHRINVFAGIALILASIFMFRQNAAWIAFLLIASLLLLYTSFVKRD
jgi:hypothetical protein